MSSSPLIAAVRASALLVLLAIAAALSLASVASAEKCTFGFDQDPRADRLPGACVRGNAGGRTAAPIAVAKDGARWYFIREGERDFDGDAGSWAARRSTVAGKVTSPGVTVDERPTGLIRGADQAIWFVAGASAGRIASDGSLKRWSLATPATGGLVTGSDGNLWYVARTSVVRLSTTGVATRFQVGARTAGGLAWERAEPPLGQAGNADDVGGASGITLGPDGAVWFSAHGSVGRVTPAGAVTLFDSILPADGGITAGPSGEQAIYYTSYYASDVVRMELPSGSQRRFGRQVVPRTTRFIAGLSGRPIEIVTGGGKRTMWAVLRTGSGTSIAGEQNLIARIDAVAFPFGRPPGEPCDPGAPATCGSYLPAWPLGYSTNFNTHEIPEGGIAIAGNNLYYTEGDSLGGIRTFRGIMKCTATDVGQIGERAAGLCVRAKTWKASVSSRGVASARMSCPRLTLRYCAGRVTLRLPSSLGGAIVGGGDFIYQSYDNPTGRFILNMAARQKLARTPGRRMQVIATLTSHDAGGLQVTRREPLLLVQSAKPDLVTSSYRYIDHSGRPRLKVTCHPAVGHPACGPTKLLTRDIVTVTLEGVPPRAGRIIEWDLNGDGIYENRDGLAFEQIQGWKEPTTATINVRVRDQGRTRYSNKHVFSVSQGICQDGDIICRR